MLDEAGRRPRWAGLKVQPVVRVLHVLEAVDTGCARHLVDVVRSVGGADHHVAIPHSGAGGRSDSAAVGALHDAGATVHHIEMRRMPLSPHNLTAIRSLRRLIRRLDPDVIHGHSTIGGLLGRLASSGSGALRVYTPNGIAAGRAATLVERAAGTLTDVFVAVSPSEREEASRRRLVREPRMTTIPNGIDPDPPDPRSLRDRLGLPPTTPLVGSISRLATQKAPDLLVTAFAEVKRRRPDASFVLVGDGPLAALVDGLATDLGLEGHLFRLDHLPSAAAYLPDLDVLAMASRFEGCPYVALEAMRAGVAVVLTDVVGNRDVVVDGRSGRLVPPEDPQALGAAIVELLDDPAERRRLAAEARRRVRECFDVTEMGERLRRVYAESGRVQRRPSHGT